MRFLRLLGLVGLLALLLAPIALALRFSDGTLVPPSGVVGKPYFHKVDGEGGCNEGDYDISVLNGSLPPGLSLVGSTTDWRIEGTPTAPGSFGFWLELKGYCPWFPGDNKTAERAIAIDIAPGLTIEQASVPTGTVGTAYGLKLTASGGGTQRWTLVGGALPPGVGLGADGSLAGMPTTKGDYPFSVKVDDGAGRDHTRHYTLAVRAPLVITPLAKAPAAEVGKAFSLPLAASGGSEAHSWSIAPETPLPAGLTFDTATRALKGLPTAAGTFPIKINVTDSESRTTSLNLDLLIAPKLAFRTATLRPAKVGKPYQAKIVTTGGVGDSILRLLRVRPITSIRFDPATGILSFTPKLPRIYTITVRAIDELKVIANQTLTLEVKAAAKTKRAKR